MAVISNTTFGLVSYFDLLSDLKVDRHCDTSRSCSTSEDMMFNSGGYFALVMVVSSLSYGVWSQGIIQYTVHDVYVFIYKLYNDCFSLERLV